MTGQYIQLAAKDGSGSFRGYLAVPASGHGPGLVIAQEIFGVNKTMRDVADYYAEEGYVALVPDLFWRQAARCGTGLQRGRLAAGLQVLRRLRRGQGHGGHPAALDVAARPARGGSSARPACWASASAASWPTSRPAAPMPTCRWATTAWASTRRSRKPENIRKPLLLHVAELDSSARPRRASASCRRSRAIRRCALHVYPGVDHAFARAGGDHFHKPSALMAHERSIAALKGAIGPHYDLSALWDKHCEYEFGTRNVDDTMATMVAEPYVNHIPTMTGGVGYRNLHALLYAPLRQQQPARHRADARSRAPSARRRWSTSCCSASPTPPRSTGCCRASRPRAGRVEMPLVAIVKFRGDKLYHEHIYWDQASVLVQVGLLDLEAAAGGRRRDGAQAARRDLPSNTLMP